MALNVSNNSSCRIAVSPVYVCFYTSSLAIGHITGLCILLYLVSHHWSHYRSMYASIPRLSPLVTLPVYVFFHTSSLAIGHITGLCILPYLVSRHWSHYRSMYSSIPRLSPLVRFSQESFLWLTSDEDDILRLFLTG
jgi:hypothetical protein